jgi:DNA-binding MarR family transcriptional regulator
MQHNIESHQKASLGHLFSRVGRMLTGHAISKVHKAGYPEVRESWLPILQHVEEKGIRSIDLANKLAISKQAANQMVKEIQKQGYLQRDPDPKDKRAQLITLTEQGWQAWVIGLKAMAEMERRLETQLGLDNVDHMRSQAAIIENILRI